MLAWMLSSLLATAAPTTAPTGASNEATALDVAAREITVLALALDVVGVSEGEAKIVDGIVAKALARHDRLRVITSADIERLMALEAEKQVMGDCSTESCLAEIAGAMGAQYVVFGQLGRLGDAVLVQLNLFDSSEARAVAREEVQAHDVGALPDKVRAAVDRLVVPLTGAPPPVEEEEASLLERPLLWAGAGTLGAGALLALGAGVPALLYSAALDDTSGNTSRATKDDALAFGPWLVVGAGAGALALVAGGALVGVAALE